MTGFDANSYGFKLFLFDVLTHQPISADDVSVSGSALPELAR